MRAALLSTDSRSLDVELDSKASVQAGFATWLPQHAGLVSSIDTGSCGDNEVKVFCQGLCTLSLRQAAAAAQPLRLRSFSTSIPCASMISALPAASLTCLELRYAEEQTDVHSPALVSAFSLLQCLREFRLVYGTPIVTNSCLKGVAQLPELAEVHLSYCKWSSLSSLPSQLQRLHLESREEDAMLVDISHLSCLRKLRIDTVTLVEGSTFPSGLTSLTVISCPLEIQTIHSLQCLQELEMEDVFSGQDHGALAHLVQLPNLRHVSLSYHAYMVHRWEILAAEAAPTWRQVTHLKELTIETVSPWVSTEELAPSLAIVGQGIAAATSLTKLSLERLPAVDFCCYIKCLTQLAHLSIEGASFSRQDALHLKQLTKLTSLSMSSCMAIDDAVAVALVSSLCKLRVLSLSGCGMVSDAVLPALEGLQDLRSLSLAGVNWLHDQSVQLLAPLTQLTRLELGCRGGLSEASRASLQQSLGDRLVLS